MKLAKDPRTVWHRVEAALADPRRGIDHDHLGLILDCPDCLDGDGCEACDDDGVKFDSVLDLKPAVDAQVAAARAPATPPAESKLVAHARSELGRLRSRRNNPADETDHAETELHESIVATVQAFATFEHSGSSAAWAREALSDLLGFQPLGPLTDDPDEWAEIGETVWQNLRKPTCFSSDGGATYYDLTEFERSGRRTYHTASPLDADHYPGTTVVTQRLGDNEQLAAARADVVDESTKENTQ